MENRDKLVCDLCKSENVLLQEWTEFCRSFKWSNEEGKWIEIDLEVGQSITKNILCKDCGEITQGDLVL